MQAIKWRGYLSSLLIRKALKVDTGAAGLTMGAMTNLLAVDTAVRLPPNQPARLHP